MLAGVDAALAWLRARGAHRLATDSRKVEAGDAFIAWPGYAFDARQFVADALAAGAVACLVEARGVEPFAFADERIAALPGLKAATGDREPLVRRADARARRGRGHRHQRQDLERLVDGAGAGAAAAVARA